MKNNVAKMLRMLTGLALGVVLLAVVASAQQPTPTPTPTPKKSADKTTQTPQTTEVGEDAGDYTIISTLEFGYRGLRVQGRSTTL
jgi:hypothetical protein